ncbi:MAG: hypothetical protein IE926_05730 [Micrococcales bacterium]|nr:hypothetical protein [Micrococcales bacterium]
MVQIAVAPIVLRDTDMKIGADNYELHLSRVRFEPQSPQLTWKGLSPSAIFVDQGTPLWTASLAGAQDLHTTNGLAQYLNDPANLGQQKVAVFKPKKGTVGTMPTYTATLVIAPVPIGGDVDTIGTFEVTLGVIGAPVRTLT